MKDKIKYILTAICSLIIMQGCNLDAKIYDGITAENIDYRNLIELSQGSYRLLKNDNGLIVSGVAFWALGGDDLSWCKPSIDERFKMYDYRRSVTSTQTEYPWELGYRTIGNCNRVIEMAEAAGSNRKAEETVMMGENYYLRALCYFLLVNEFAQPYSNNPEQNPGLPLKLNSDPNDLPPSRSTVKQIYDQIEKDLLDAIKYMALPAGMQPKSNIYATKEAAEALLARVYLYMGRWDDARKYADNVINSGRFSLLTGNDYVKYPQFIPEDNKETIFAVRRTKDKDGSTWLGTVYYKIDESGYEEIHASSRYMELQELYLDPSGTPKDLRSKFILKGGDATRKTPHEDYSQLRFVYSRLKEGSDVYYGYSYVKVNKESDGSYSIIDPKDKSKFGDKVKSEPYNLGTRYFIMEGTTKYIGRVENTNYEIYDQPIYAISKCSYQEQRTHMWSPVISRLSEMYLIRAEANAELGNTQLALDDVNVIRRRAGIPEWTTTNMATAEAGKAKDIKKIVEEERMLELAWEGHRRFDVFRRRATLDRHYPGAHASGEISTVRLEIPYNDKAVCEFIPQAQYDAYPHKLEQNP